MARGTCTTSTSNTPMMATHRIERTNRAVELKSVDAAFGKRASDKDFEKIFVFRFRWDPDWVSNSHRSAAGRSRHKKQYKQQRQTTTTTTTKMTYCLVQSQCGLRAHIAAADLIEPSILILWEFFGRHCWKEEEMRNLLDKIKGKYLWSWCHKEIMSEQHLPWNQIECNGRSFRTKTCRKIHQAFVLWRSSQWWPPFISSKARTKAAIKIP